MPEAATTAGLRHAVFLYRGRADYRAAIAGFVRTGLARKEPVLLAVPRPAAAVPDWPAGRSALVTVADMAQLGRNPARLIQALRSFADRHRGRRHRIISESVWAGRSAAELCEAARIEALIDAALSGLEATMMCPYDAAALPAAALADATKAHQWRLEADDIVPSTEYSGLGILPAACSRPLAGPPPGAELVRYRTDLRPVRAMVTATCERAGMSAMRATDLTLAVSELAANTLQHTSADGVAQAWLADGEVVCQITDSGVIRDPLAGFLRPQLDQAGGHGLWLVNQVCDLVEVRSSAAGTVIRLHMRVNRG